MRAFAALVFPFEERPIAVLVAPGGHRLGRALVDHHLLVNPVDPGAGDGMMMPTGAWVALGEDDAVATHLVDRADMLSVRSHHRSEEHTSELQSLMRISYAVFCL